MTSECCEGFVKDIIQKMSAFNDKPSDNVLTNLTFDSEFNPSSLNVIIYDNMKVFVGLFYESLNLLRSCSYGSKLYYERLYVASICIDMAIVSSNRIFGSFGTKESDILVFFSALKRLLNGAVATAKLEGKCQLTPYSPGELPDDTVIFGEGVLRGEHRRLYLEAHAILFVAQMELKYGLVEEASRNFHLVAVTLKVLLSECFLSSDLFLNVLTTLTSVNSLKTNLCLESFGFRSLTDHYQVRSKSTNVSVKIGSGSYGIVHLCRHKSTNDKFACKTIALNYSKPYYLRRAHLEVDILRRIEHPNIARLTEVFFSKRAISLILELGAGGELYTHLKNHCRAGISEIHAAMLLKDMIRAVKYLHLNGIAHRDLKLENFVFESSSSYSRLKLIDFGLATYTGKHERLYHQVGSPCYIAPEVIRGNYDMRCDLWSLGIISYMLLTSTAPFVGPDVDSIHKCILEQEVDFSDSKFSGRSYASMSFVRSLLMKDPDDRCSLDDCLKSPLIGQLSSCPNVGADPLTSVEIKSRFDPPPADVWVRMAEFCLASDSRKFMFTAVAAILNTKQVSLISDYFLYLDEHCCGCFTVAAAKEKLISVHGDVHPGSSPSSSVAIVPMDFSKEVMAKEFTYLDFIAATLLSYCEIDEVRILRAFQNLDPESTGVLTLESIQVYSGISNLNPVDIFKDLDILGTGSVTLEHFVNYWKEIVKPEVKLVRRGSGGYFSSLTATFKGFFGNFRQPKSSRIMGLECGSSNYISHSQHSESSVSSCGSKDNLDGRERDSGVDSLLSQVTNSVRSRVNSNSLPRMPYVSNSYLEK